MKSWLSNQSFSTWIKSHVELIKEGRNVKVIAKKYVFRCAFFFFLHIIYTHSSSFQISLKFSLTFFRSFPFIYFFLVHDFSNNNQISVYRIREIGMELLENKDFRNGRYLRSLFFFLFQRSRRVLYALNRVEME